MPLPPACTIFAETTDPVEILRTFWQQALGWAGPAGLAAAFVAATALGVQLYYLLGAYRRIAGYRNKPVPPGTPLPAVSAVVALHDPDYRWLEHTLPLLLGQEHPQFELVVVDVAGSEDFTERLAALAAADGRLTVTRMKKDPRFPINDKLAHNVGIKAARYECVVLTLPDSRPASPRWLTAMAKGFMSAGLVLGFAAPERGRKGRGRLAAADNAAVGTRWLGAAVKGKPYRGTVRNLGFTRGLYFARGGFNRLNLNVGEGDLFVQAAAADSPAAVVAGPRSTVLYRVPGGASAWTAVRLRDSYAVKFYPRRAKLFIGAELWSRALFFAAAAAAAVLLPPAGALAAAGAVALRFLTALAVARRTCVRLGQRGLVLTFPLTDLLDPAWEAYLAVRRRFKTPPGVWK